jgi:hypothetical protein
MGLTYAAIRLLVPMPNHIGTWKAAADWCVFESITFSRNQEVVFFVERDKENATLAQILGARRMWYLLLDQESDEDKVVIAVMAEPPSADSPSVTIAMLDVFFRKLDGSPFTFSGDTYSRDSDTIEVYSRNVVDNPIGAGTAFDSLHSDHWGIYTRQ